MRAHRRRRLRDAEGGGEAGPHRAEEGRRLTFSGVSATACWTAYCRALDGEAWAAELLDDEATRIGRSLEARVSVRAAVASRTERVDRLIFQAISRDGVQTIVSLGSGLDARPWRMRAPGVEWIEVDGAQLLAWKRERLERLGVAPAKTIAADLAVTSDVEAVVREARGRTLFVAEGVLQYLAPAAARSLLSTLAGRDEWTGLVADVGGGAWSRCFGRVQRLTRTLGAPYRTRVADVDPFFRAAGWRVRSVESLASAFRKPWSAWLVPGWSQTARVVSAENDNRTMKFRPGISAI